MRAVVADASRPRQRGGGYDPLLARREAPHNHADQADFGRQSLRLFRPRGLSAAPLSTIHAEPGTFKMLVTSGGSWGARRPVSSKRYRSRNGGIGRRSSAARHRRDVYSPVSYPRYRATPAEALASHRSLVASYSLATAGAWRWLAGIGSHLRTQMAPNSALQWDARSVAMLCRAFPRFAAKPAPLRRPERGRWVS